MPDRCSIRMCTRMCMYVLEYHLADPTSYEAKLDALLFESYPSSMDM